MENAHFGFVAEHALWQEDDWDAAERVLETVREKKLNTIRVSFPDQHGILRGKTLVADGLAGGMRDGVAMTSSLLLKDTSHRTVFDVWGTDAGPGVAQLTGARDVILVLEPQTFHVLPWAEHAGWIMGDLYRTDGTPISLTGRRLLRESLGTLEARGQRFVTGLEVEFHVMRAAHSTDVRPNLLAEGFQYLTEERYDQLSPVFDLILANAQALNLPIRSLESEFGPSQCEITFERRDGLQNADNMVLFRSMVKQVCRRAGYHATFMCAPKYPGTMASGWHLHQSVADATSGANLFESSDGETLSPLGASWVAGLLEHAREACIFAAPTVNGYRRFRAHGMAPDRIQWSLDNKGAMLRVVTSPADASRVENRLGEPAANPYLYLASQVVAGIDGIDKQLTLPPSVDAPYSSDAGSLPTNLGTAIDALDAGDFFRRTFGASFVDYYVHLKRAEWERYLSALSQWEHDEYFDTF